MMSSFISKMNTADALAKLCRQGQMTPILLKDALQEMGFKKVVIFNGNVYVKYDDTVHKLRSV